MAALELRDLSAVPGTVMRQNRALEANVRKLCSRICHLLLTPECSTATDQELRRLGNKGTTAKGECWESWVGAGSTPASITCLLDDWEEAS